jgi:hypothetical protein
VSPLAASASKAELAAHWKIWIQFCNDMQINPGLFHIRHPIPFIQVFMQLFRNGELAPGGKPISARHAEDADCSVGPTMAGLGARDYRKDPRTGKLDFRLAQQQAGYRKRDMPHPKKPEISKAALIQLQQWASTGPQEEVLADLIWLAFFFLIRPGTYVCTNSDLHPFILEDITFKIATIAYTADIILLELLKLASYLGLHFTEQKNGIKIESIQCT